jgi:hypothetical protein
MKCMISGKEFEENKAFPPLAPSEKGFGNLAQRQHAEEASKWHHVQLLVDGKEVLAGHLSPDVNTKALGIVESK